MYYLDDIPFLSREKQSKQILVAIHKDLVAQSDAIHSQEQQLSYLAGGLWEVWGPAESTEARSPVYSLPSAPIASVSGTWSYQIDTRGKTSSIPEKPLSVL